MHPEWYYDADMIGFYYVFVTLVFLLIHLGNGYNICRHLGAMSIGTVYISTLKKKKKNQQISHYQNVENVFLVWEGSVWFDIIRVAVWVSV